jgi:hypothetical protein
MVVGQTLQGRCIVGNISQNPSSSATSDTNVNATSGAAFVPGESVAGPLHFTNFIVEYAKMLLMWR